MMHEPAPTDVAYLAGVLDGEGSICIFRSTHRDGSPRHWINVTIGNTHHGVLEWIRSIFGGRIASNAEQYKPQNHETWRWRVNAKEAAITLRLVSAYLKIKTEQASIAIEFQEHIEQCSQPGTTKPKSADELAWREAQKGLLSQKNLRYRPVIVPDSELESEAEDEEM
jgi:hypothetical protein